MSDTEISYYHTLDLPDGTVTKGVCDHREQPRLLGLDAPGLLAGKRVLDIGANDGFWSFWAEKAGAEDVLAIDVENYRGYDWNHEGPPPVVATHRQQDKASAFWHLKTVFNSNVRRESIPVYDLKRSRHGEFDLVVFYGVLYHLRHPLLSFDAIRDVCRGCVVVETHVVGTNRLLPNTLFYLDDVFAGHTNWTGATEACIVHWMRSAGFTTVFREVVKSSPAYLRQRFVGTLTDDWAKVFMDNPHFALCDANYFAACRREIQQKLGLLR